MSQCEVDAAAMEEAVLRGNWLANIVDAEQAFNSLLALTEVYFVGLG